MGLRAELRVLRRVDARSHETAVPRECAEVGELEVLRLAQLRQLRDARECQVIRRELKVLFRFIVALRVSAGLVVDQPHHRVPETHDAVDAAAHRRTVDRELEGHLARERVELAVLVEPPAEHLLRVELAAVLDRDAFEHGRIPQVVQRREKRVVGRGDLAARAPVDDVVHPRADEHLVTCVGIEPKLHLIQVLQRAVVVRGQPRVTGAQILRDERRSGIGPRVLVPPGLGVDAREARDVVERVTTFGVGDRRVAHRPAPRRFGLISRQRFRSRGRRAPLEAEVMEER